MFSAPKRCLFAQCFFMWRLISVRSTCFSQFGHVAFLSSPKCSSLMCLLQLDWLEKGRSQVRQRKVPSNWRWQSWLAASSIAAATGWGWRKIRTKKFPSPMLLCLPLLLQGFISQEIQLSLYIYTWPRRVWYETGWIPFRNLFLYVCKGILGKLKVNCWPVPSGLVVVSLKRPSPQCHAGVGRGLHYFLFYTQNPKKKLLNFNYQHL